MHSRWMMRGLIVLAFALCPAKTTAAGAGETVIHRGEEFTSPGGGLNEELRFVREFSVSREQLAKQPEAQFGSKPPLSATRAIELAQASLDPSGSDGDDDAHVTKLELHSKGSLLFYRVDFHVDGSEVQRVVLMDGTVVKPQLTRLPTKAEDKR